MSTTRALFVTTLLLCAPAGAAAADEAPATSADARTVLMWLDGALRPGLWLTGEAGGWSVALPVASSDACTARLHDISPAPLPREDRVEALAPGQPGLMLPRPRYTGSHTYRISFRCEHEKRAELLVHLDPSQAEQTSWLDTPAPVAARKFARR